MINNITKHLSQSVVYALMASALIVSLLFATFLLAEPVISHGQTEVFTIQQTITDETSFLVPPTDVTMAAPINGVTGGNATGTTQFVVTTNNSAGYNVTISYEGTPEAMVGDATGNLALRDYDGDVVGEPSYNYVASTSAQFAYTVISSSTAVTDQSFLSDGSSACNTSSTEEVGFHCWKSPSTTPFMIVNKGTSAVTGATTSVQFNVNVPSGASPVPAAESYTATATLSLTIN